MPLDEKDLMAITNIVNESLDSKLGPMIDSKLESILDIKLKPIYDKLSDISRDLSEIRRDLGYNHTNWKSAKNKEEIPLYSFLLTQEEPSPEAISWAKSII